MFGRSRLLGGSAWRWHRVALAGREEIASPRVSGPARPLATAIHQAIVFFLAKLLDRFVALQHLGEVFMAPLPIRLRVDTLREPDVLFVRAGRLSDRRQPPNGADLVMEVVSEGADNRRRDLEVKRREYAEAGIAEYWIVDPVDVRIIVLTLDGTAYREHGSFASGATATSVLLPGFTVDVADVFAAGGG